MRAFWDEVSTQASKTIGVKKSARGWEMKYGRLRKAYENYVREVNISGREGDSSDVIEVPRFFTEIHELEHRSTRNNPPGAMSSEIVPTCNVFGKELSSTRKRNREGHLRVLKEIEAGSSKRHAELLSEVREGNRQRAQLVGFVGELVNTLKSSLGHKEK